MKKIIILCLLSFLLTGCLLDPYKNEKDAVAAIESWFNYKNGEDDIGLTRRRIENISEIKNTNCTYVENDENKIYIYLCEVEYSPIGETIIPLSKNETKSMYVAISYNEDRTYNYIVYNSSYQDAPYLLDDSLNYNKN